MEKGKNIHNIEIKIEGQVWKDAIDASFNKVIKNIKIDGFRQGKVPRDVYEKKYGKDSLYMDAVDNVLPLAYTEALKKVSKEPIVRPNVDIKSVNEDGVIFGFTITSKPTIKIKKYKNLNIKKEIIKVSDEDVENEIKVIQKQYAELVLKDGKIEKGDTVIIDFKGYKDEKQFDGGTSENYSLEIGSNTFIPGFEEALIGLQKKI